MHMLYARVLSISFIAIPQTVIHSHVCGMNDRHATLCVLQLLFLEVANERMHISSAEFNKNFQHHCFCKHYGAFQADCMLNIFFRILFLGHTVTGPI